MVLCANILKFTAGSTVLMCLGLPFFGQQPQPDRIEMMSAKAAVGSRIKPSKGKRSRAAKRTVDEQERVVAASPNDPIALNDLGVMYVEVKRYKDAISALKRSIELAPKITKSHYNLSVAYDLAGQPRNALPFAEKAAAGFPDELPVIANLCRIYFVLKRYTNALQCYEGATKRWPEDVLSRSNYAAALLLAGRPKQAAATLKTIIAAWPRYDGAYNALGVIQQRQKKYKDAAASFKTAIELDPANSIYRYNLALAHLRLKNRSGAISQYRVLKTSDPALASALYKYLYRGRVIYVPKL